MKFRVYKNGKPVEDFALYGTYMFGTDLVPLRDADNINFSDNAIHCVPLGTDSAGIALLWPVDGYGKVILPTTCLPPREEPYILNVELARAKLMQITLKKEDWSFFEEDANSIEQSRKAQDLFITSLKQIKTPEKASETADKALSAALKYSELLAGRYAEYFINIRARNKSLGRHSLGCQIDPELLENEKYRKWLLEMFGFVTIPINWAKIEPAKGEYDFSSIDRCIDLLSGRRLAISAGPLVNFRKDSLPPWLFDKKMTFEKVREAAYYFISHLVARYKNYIHAWRVISGMNCENIFGFNFEQAVEMTRAACLAAKSAEGRSRKIIEIKHPWGEYYALDKNTFPPAAYVDTVIQSGISFDAFGVSLSFGKDSRGMHMRDIMQISSKLDFFLPVPKPLHITGLEIPDTHRAEGQGCDCAGLWRKNWDQQVQSNWIEQFYRIALGKPFLNSITYSSLADSENNGLKGSGLLNDRFEPKKAFMSIAKIQNRILRR